MKKIIIVGLLALGSLATSGCSPDTAEDKQTVKTQQALEEINREVGMPNIHNFQEKKLAKLVIEQRDRVDLICYAYVKSEMTGKLVFVGKCVGYGLPYAVQYTNPQKIEGHGGGLVVTPQADPNGLYMPADARATWLLMIDPKTNEPKPVYFESDVIVSPFPLL